MENEKSVILDALRGRNKDELLALLADALRNKSEVLLDVCGVARISNCGTRTVWRLRDSGRMPAPVYVGGTRCIRWKNSDILEWVAANCPDCRRTGWTPSGKGASI